MFGKYENRLYSEIEKESHLESLLTDLGERNLYDAVSQCNRCGYCETACPTYACTWRETISARGRNQAVRMLIEGKIKNAAETAESVFTCLLCGACSSVCYAKVPTPDNVLEARRNAISRNKNSLVSAGMRMLLENPGIFEVWLKIAYVLKNLGASKIVSGLQIYEMAGLPELDAVQQIVRKVPLTFLNETLRKDTALSAEKTKNAAWAYFAACGPNYLFPKVGTSTVKLLKRFMGNGIFADNFCCGLLAYNYESLKNAREFAKQNIRKFEELKKNNPDVVLVGDCASCVSFMKTYEQLFTGDEGWRQRALEFSKSVKDILEVIKPEQIPLNPPLLKGDTGGFKKDFIITYHDSCKACHGQNIRTEPRKVIKKLAGADFREMDESDWCCGGAGAFAFTHKELSSQILQRKIRNIACSQADIVAVGATSCLLHINHGLRMLYPRAKAVHYSVLIDKLLVSNNDKM
ncbi:MAG: (Fe-S)-binding protein [Elusimicrobia bacterium]|nr:(Fe-S)-binding protein [Elusimicrobiota bacterium]